MLETHGLPREAEAFTTWLRWFRRVHESGEEIFVRAGRLSMTPSPDVIAHLRPLRSAFACAAAEAIGLALDNSGCVSSVAFPDFADSQDGSPSGFRVVAVLHDDLRLEPRSDALWVSRGLIPIPVPTAQCDALVGADAASDGVRWAVRRTVEALPARSVLLGWPLHRIPARLKCVIEETMRGAAEEADGSWGRAESAWDTLHRVAAEVHDCWCTATSIEELDAFLAVREARWCATMRLGAEGKRLPSAAVPLAWETTWSTVVEPATARQRATALAELAHRPDVDGTTLDLLSAAVDVDNGRTQRAMDRLESSCDRSPLADRHTIRSLAVDLAFRLRDPERAARIFRGGPAITSLSEASATAAFSLRSGHRLTVPSVEWIREQGPALNDWVVLAACSRDAEVLAEAVRAAETLATDATGLNTLAPLVEACLRVRDGALCGRMATVLDRLGLPTEGGLVRAAVQAWSGGWREATEYDAPFEPTALREATRWIAEAHARVGSPVRAAELASALKATATSSESSSVAHTILVLAAFRGAEGIDYLSPAVSLLTGSHFGRLGAGLLDSALRLPRPVRGWATGFAVQLVDGLRHTGVDELPACVAADGRESIRASCARIQHRIASRGFDETRRSLEEFVESVGWEPEAVVYLAELLLWKGETADAREVLERARRRTRSLRRWVGMSRPALQRTLDGATPVRVPKWIQVGLATCELLAGSADAAARRLRGKASVGPWAAVRAEARWRAGLDDGVELLRLAAASQPDRFPTRVVACIAALDSGSAVAEVPVRDLLARGWTVIEAVTGEAPESEFWNNCTSRQLRDALEAVLTALRGNRSGAIISFTAGSDELRFQSTSRAEWPYTMFGIQYTV